MLKNILITGFLLHLKIGLFAQVPTPESANIGGNSSSSVNHAYGLSSVSVPIYNLKEGDLEIPISLNYTGSGVRVEDVAPREGLGFHLNAGGSITRIVRDKPDEGFVPEKPNTFSIGINFGNLSGGFTFTQNTAYMKSSKIYNYSPLFVFMGGWFYNGKPQYDSTRANPNIFDHSPDIFIINVAGKSIRFLFDENQEIKVLNGEDIKIEYTFTPFSPYLLDTNSPQNLTVRGFTNWTVTFSDGTKYVFGEPNATFPNSNYQSQYYEYSYDLSLIGPGANDPYVFEYSLASQPTKWHLQKIVSPVGNNEIKFSYQPKFYQYNLLREYEQIHNPNNCIFPKTIISEMRAFVPSIKSIESANYLVEFNSTEVFNLQSQIPNFTEIIKDFTPNRYADSTRADVNFDIDDTQKATALKNVLIKDKATNSKKAFYFDTDYFETKANLNDIPKEFNNDETWYWGSSSIPVTVTYNYIPQFVTTSNDHKRLRLRGVYEIAMETGNYKILNGHSFEYEMNELPRRLSQARDHWGFYNGRHDNSQKSNLMPLSYNGLDNCSIVSNRESNFNFGKAGLLTKVFYPTGFQVTYNYEPNDASNWNQINQIGGFRVESIESKDCLTNQTKLVKYEYKLSNNISSGFISLKPRYFFKHNTTIGANSINYVIQSAGHYSFLIGNFLNGGFISYKRVIERELGNGYTEYQFYADETNSQITDFTNVVLDQIPFFDFKRGALNKITHFNESNQSLKSIDYIYTSDNLVRKKVIKGGFLMPIDAIPGRLKYNIEVRLSIHVNGISPSLNANFYTEQIKFVKYNYDIPIGRFNLEKTIEKNFDQAGQNPVITETERFYESTRHNLMTRIKTTYASGQVKEKFNRYAKDFVYTGLTPISSATYSIDGNSIIGLQDKFMNPLIEQYVKRNGKVIEGKIYQFSELAATKGLLKKEFDLETDVALTDYVPAIHEKIQIVYSGAIVNSFKPDARYVEKKEYLSYNAQGMPLEIKETNGATTKFGYSNNGLVISSITNASNTSDSARVRYENNLLFGLSKKIQANETFDTFSYDGAGRLKEIRDIDNNISKRINYKYATIQCIANPIQVSGDFQICLNNNAVFNALGCIGLVKWYNSQLVNIHSGTTFIKYMPSSNQDFYVSCTVGGLESSKSKFSIQVSNNYTPSSFQIKTTTSFGDFYVTTTIQPNSSITLQPVNYVCSGNIVWNGGSIQNQTGQSKTITPTTDAIYSARCVNNVCQSDISSLVQVRICNDLNEPNNSTATATTIPVANIVSCLIYNDEDFFKIVINGSTYYVKVHGYSGISGVYQLLISVVNNQLILETIQDTNSTGGFDTVLTLFGATGNNWIGYNDDHGGTLFSKIIYDL